MSETEKKTLSERLTPEQKARLQNLVAEVEHERITVAFSIDERDINGRKQSAFFSDTIRRKSVDGSGAAFNNDDSRLLRLWLSKQVIANVYDQAVKNRMFTGAQASDQLRAILEAYDVHIAKLLSAGSAVEEGPAQ